MILPIVAYGHPTLRRKSVDIEKGHPGLDELIENMYETMYSSDGVGLAAPQVNESIRLFIVDATPFAEEAPELSGFRKVFINAQIVEETGEPWSFNEGCLSIPDIREDVIRRPKVRIQYYDREWNFHDEEFDGILARIIQHEYDHTEGILFVDKISPLRKILLKKKLANISNGDIEVSYKMIFPSQQKRKRQHSR